MNAAAQVFVKNRFLHTQNRDTLNFMNEKDRARSRKWMLFLAVGIALAILAPVAVLAA